MPNINSTKLYVILLGAQSILESFAATIPQAASYLELKGGDSFSVKNTILEVRRQIRRTRVALDMIEDRLNKAYGLHSAMPRIPIKKRKDYIMKPHQDIEGCSDWPECEDTCPIASDEEE